MSDIDSFLNGELFYLIDQFTPRGKRVVDKDMAKAFGDRPQPRCWF